MALWGLSFRQLILQTPQSKSGVLNSLQLAIAVPIAAPMAAIPAPFMAAVSVL